MPHRDCPLTFAPLIRCALTVVPCGSNQSSDAHEPARVCRTSGRLDHTLYRSNVCKDLHRIEPCRQNQVNQCPVVAAAIAVADLTVRLLFIPTQIGKAGTPRCSNRSPHIAGPSPVDMERPRFRNDPRHRAALNFAWTDTSECKSIGCHFLSAAVRDGGILAPGSPGDSVRLNGLGPRPMTCRIRS